MPKRAIKPHIMLGGHRGLGCTDHDFYQGVRDIAVLPVENTLQSVAAGFDAGAAYVEIDAQLSADGIAFVLHNVVPEDHFLGIHKPDTLLNNLNFTEIAQFKTGRFENGEVATLSDMLALIDERDPETAPWAVNIEIKGVQGSGQEFEKNDFLNILADTVNASAVAPERILWSSFCLQNIIAMSHLMPGAHFGLLFSDEAQARPIYADHCDEFKYRYLPLDAAHLEQAKNRWHETAAPQAALTYAHPEITTVTSDMIDAVAAHGMGLNVWASLEALDDARLQHYKNLIIWAETAGIPLTMMTDYLPELKALVG